MQSAFVLQMVLHAPPGTQRYGAHETLFPIASIAELRSALQRGPM
jgi:hypothetical protein